MLATILREHWLTARAVVGFYPCNSVDEEIEVYSDATRTRVLDACKLENFSPAAK